MQMNETKKLTLIKIRQEGHLTIQQVAEKAEIGLREIYLAELGVPVGVETGWRIVYALNQLTGGTYTLSTLSVRIKGGIVFHRSIEWMSTLP
jgi:hypothetical protein